MANISLNSLLEAGVHFGHRVSRWNPKMAPFIYGKRNLIHIIDLKMTIRGLLRSTYFLSRLAGTGKQVLFVGTKRQARGLVERTAKALDMPFVCDRWIGGLLTNNSVVKVRLERLFELERMEEDGSINVFKKKEISALRREKRRILRNLDGVRSMDQLPGALVVVDPNREKTAVLEANRLGIPVVAFLDTDCDPDPVDIAIPGNDDAMRSIEVVLEYLAQSVGAGRKSWLEQKAAEEKAQRDREERERREREMIEAARKKRAAETAAEQAGGAAPEAAPAAAPAPQATPSPLPTPAATVEAPAAPEPKPETAPAPAADPAVTFEPTPEPKPEPKAEPKPEPTPEPKPEMPAEAAEKKTPEAPAGEETPAS